MKNEGLGEAEAPLCRKDVRKSKSALFWDGLLRRGFQCDFQKPKQKESEAREDEHIWDVEGCGTHA